MNGLEINRAITRMIKEKIPQKNKVVPTLSDLFGIGAKAIYRRLNDEVFFTFWEICRLSSVLGISLDGFVQNNLTGINSHGLLALSQSNESVKITKSILWQMKQVLAKLADDPHAEVGTITNCMPVIFYCYNKELLMFNSYYTNHQDRNNKTYTEFKQNKGTQQLIDEIYNLYMNCLQIRHHTILMDRDLIKNILQQMNYVRSIRGLTDAEYDQLKDIIRNSLHYMEETLDSGLLPHSESKCDIYLSDIRIDPNYLYVWSDTLSFSSMQMYVLGRKISFDYQYNTHIREWLDLWRNNAVHITKCNLNERIGFFEEQWKALEE